MFMFFPENDRGKIWPGPEHLPRRRCRELAGNYRPGSPYFGDPGAGAGIVKNASPGAGFPVVYWVFPPKFWFRHKILIFYCSLNSREKLCWTCMTRWSVLRSSPPFTKTLVLSPLFSNMLILTGLRREASTVTDSSNLAILLWNEGLGLFTPLYCPDCVFLGYFYHGGKINKMSDYFNIFYLLDCSKSVIILRSFWFI